MIFAPKKWPNLHIIIAQKYFFPDFFLGRGHVPCLPPLISYAYGKILLDNNR